MSRRGGFLCRLDKWFGMKEMKRIWCLGMALQAIFGVKFCF
jgi:hypothetical protein